MSAELALQRHVVAALRSAPGVTSLVPATNIADEHGRPERFPAIRLGESASFPADLDESFHDLVSFDVVVWSASAGTGEAKTIAAAIRAALPVGIWRVPGLRHCRAKIAGQHVTRDAAKDTVRAVVAFDVVAQS
ncbi:DUF3168 domain-containing protein [Methylopila sp. Yamaguchi]|uniref:DUF3168 domain-containing protein n=1 Tax=Methylopila sp. Yamaguchi TaxID=1437817 RepID=UPI000CA68A5A|nr:DUF3168 domain-containing protein [Methylopila sp. Yamaguchi]GBD48537.1 hypothetical protein METY_1750 [Methylopila sp. Yamaguchi]